MNIIGKKIIVAWVVMACSALGSMAWAGPVILGGGDPTEHGSVAGGVNLLGWKYIENATSGVLAAVTRTGATGIAVLGSSDSTVTTNNAGAAMHSVGAKLGVAVTYHEGVAAITTFFTNLAAGTVNPKMIYLPGQGSNNDLDTAEGAALTTNAAAIAAFVASGGGVLSHGSGTTAYGWLSALLPGIVEAPPCSTPVTLTAAGITQFPGVSNADVSSGPCHSTFSGNLGGLAVLATDSGGRNMIIGGAGVTSITSGPVQPIPTISAWGAASLVILMMMAGLLGLRRKLS